MPHRGELGWIRAELDSDPLRTQRRRFDRVPSRGGGAGANRAYDYLAHVALGENGAALMALPAVSVGNGLGSDRQGRPLVPQGETP